MAGKDFWNMFLRDVFEALILREYFSLSQNESTPNLVKSGVQNGESLFEKVYSSSSSCMDALSENKQ